MSHFKSGSDREKQVAPEPGAPLVPELEVDESVAPRPEEEIADVARANPDLEDHSERGAVLGRQDGTTLTGEA